MQEKRRRQQRNQRILIISGVVLLAIAVVIILILSNKPAESSATAVDVTVPTSRARPQVQDNHMGDPNAPVKVTEYSDYQCPYCANFWRDTEPQIVDTYVKTGKVYYTVRSMGNFISDNINQGAGTNDQESGSAAQAAYCAGDQNRFFDYHDTLFNNQQPENSGNLNRAYFDSIAQKLGLDMTQFKQCMDSNKYANQVTQDGVEGKQAVTSAPNYDNSGIGTPSFIINGKLISGSQPFSAFQTEIDAALAAAGK